MKLKQELKVNEFFEDIYPKRIPIHRKTLKKEFKGWHKPRKQFIRKYQWNGEIEKFINNLEINNSKILSYLTLPGIDYFDIRVLHDLCASKGINIKYLAFNNGIDSEDKKNEQILVENEIKSLECIEKDSQTVLDDIRQVGIKDSIAYQAAEKSAPFDVINLDLCSAILAGPDPEYFKSLHQLLNIQFDKRKKPWLLFLTTHVQNNRNYKEYIDKVFSCIWSNINDSDYFKESFEMFSDLNFDEFSSNKEFTKNLYGMEFFKAFGVGLGKWLLQLMLSARPRSSVNMLKSYHYRVNRKSTPNMLSLVYLFEPEIIYPNDPSGLVNCGTSKHMAIDESNLACRIITSFQDNEDLDRMMEEKQQLCNEMINESIILLGLARYQLEKYEKWARNELFNMRISLKRKQMKIPFTKKKSFSSA